MDILKPELGRNLSAYFLVLLGVFCLICGHHVGDPEITKTGGILVSASLLAFQAKRSPDGNTTTTQVTVPPPDVAAPVAPKSTFHQG